MLKLGAKIIANIDEENINAIFMDKDFMDRTVLNLITTFGYVPLLGDEKVTVLLDELWEGKNTYECDGKVSYYSKLTFLANNTIVKLPGKQVGYT